MNKPKPPYDITMCTNKECVLRDECLRNPDHYDMNNTIMSYADLFDSKLCRSFIRKEKVDC